MLHVNGKWCRVDVNKILSAGGTNYLLADAGVPFLVGYKLRDAVGVDVCLAPLPLHFMHVVNFNVTL
jgi:hypothetical protein